MRKKPVGKILPARTMILRADAGEAKDATGAIRYEMSTDICSGTPLIRCVTTGRWWTINWADLISLAEAAGIDTPEKSP